MQPRREERAGVAHVLTAFRFHSVELRFLLGGDKSCDLRIRLGDPIRYLFRRRLTDRIDVDCRLLDQRFDLRSLLGSEREAPL